jgi:type IV secretory pathway VirB2 component (pilin)
MSNLILSKSAKNISSLFILAVVMMIFIVPFLAQAQGGGNPGCTGTVCIENPFKEDSIEGFIKTIVNDILIPIGGVVAVMMIIYAGFLYVTARGNDTKITEARKALTWAVIGAAILLGAWVISQAIQTTISQLKG